MLCYLDAGVAKLKFIYQYAISNKSLYIRSSSIRQIQWLVMYIYHARYSHTFIDIFAKFSK